MSMGNDGSFAWPQQVAKRMADDIHNEVRGTVAHSRLVRKSEGIALVDRKELVIGCLLGKGAFSEVHEVRAKSPTGETHTFAMKHLKMKLMGQPENFRLAASELAVEAHMLASFNHPNVMKIRGWAANGVASFVSGKHDAFFLLLDKLDETLDGRIENWEKQTKMMLSHSEYNVNPVLGLWRRFSNHVSPEQQLMAERIQEFQDRLYLEKLNICSQIASALSYLHQNGVIFRDLKPNNIGFLNGRVQLFDFGLSREIPQLDVNTPFEMSGKVGTLRYMAVEVACHRRYNVSADVYSWAMVCYEVLTHTKPFAGWTREMHQNLVCGRGLRPEVHQLPADLAALLRACWSQHAHERPHMLAAMHKTRLLEDAHLLACPALHKKTEELISVELPRDFSIRKPVDRAFSYTTNTTMSISMESLTDYM